MDQNQKYCPNCDCKVNTDSQECPRCYTKVSRNLENFLLAKYKLFTLIGIFGALSIYLLNNATPESNPSNPFLHVGSLLSLMIVIILSIICIWDLVHFIKIEEPDYKEFPLSTIIKSIRILPAMILFFVFFICLISILTIYVLSNPQMAQVFVFTLSIIVFLLIFIGTYYTYRYYFEKLPELLNEKLTGKISDIGIRRVIIVIFGVFSFFLVFLVAQMIQTQILVLPMSSGNLTLSLIGIIICITLLIDCLNLMYKRLTFVPIIPLENSLSELNSSSENVAPMPMVTEQEKRNPTEMIKIDENSTNQRIHKNVLNEFYEAHVLPYMKPVKRFITYFVAIIVFMYFAMEYESHLLPNNSIELVVAIIGGIISGVIIILFQKGMGE